MPVQLEREDVIERLQRYPAENYLYIGSIIKGVALTFAMLVAVNILAAPRTFWPLLAPLIASLCAIVVSYMTWGRGVLLTNARSNLNDHIAPLTMGLLESALFGVLLPNQYNEYLWQYWFLVLGCHSLFAVILVRNRIKNVFVVEDFERSLRPLVHEYLSWLRKDQAGAFAIFVVSVGVWLIEACSIWKHPPTKRTEVIHSLLAGIVIIPLIMAIRDADRQRHRIDKLVSQEPEDALR